MRLQYRCWYGMPLKDSFPAPASAHRSFFHRIATAIIPDGGAHYVFLLSGHGNRRQAIYGATTFRRARRLVLLSRAQMSSRVSAGPAATPSYSLFPVMLGLWKLRIFLGSLDFSKVCAV